MFDYAVTRETCFLTSSKLQVKLRVFTCVHFLMLIECYLVNINMSVFIVSISIFVFSSCCTAVMLILRVINECRSRNCRWYSHNGESGHRKRRCVKRWRRSVNSWHSTSTRSWMDETHTRIIRETVSKSLTDLQSRNLDHSINEIEGRLTRLTTWRFLNSILPHRLNTFSRTRYQISVVR